MLRDKERKLTSKYDIQYKDWVKDENVEKCLVSEDDVADVVSLITGIPVSKVAESETDRLLNMAKNLRKRIIEAEV